MKQQYQANQQQAAAFCATGCFAAAAALSTSDSRLLGVLLVLGIAIGIAVRLGIRIIPALVRRQPAA